MVIPDYFPIVHNESNTMKTVWWKSIELANMKTNGKKKKNQDCFILVVHFYKPITCAYS